jgi:small subunit ribosomal protein S6
VHESPNCSFAFPRIPFTSVQYARRADFLEKPKNIREEVNILAEETTPQAVEETAAPEAETSEATTETTQSASAVRPVQKAFTDLAPELSDSESDAPRKEVENGRAYEVTFIALPNKPEALENTQTRVKALIENGGGAVDNVRVSEVRRLAYPINKRSEGVYVVLNGRFKQSVVEELDRLFKLDENVLRHVVLRDSE